MTRASSGHRGRTGAALLATLFAVLFGFFAMHGVAAHGVSHADGSDSAIPGTAQPVDHHTGTGMHERGAINYAPDADGQPEPAPSSPDDGGDAGEACLAILGLLLIALVVMAVRRGQPSRPMVILRRIKTRLIVHARPAEPPCLHRLSILRS